MTGLGWGLRACISHKLLVIPTLLVLGPHSESQECLRLFSQSNSTTDIPCTGGGRGVTLPLSQVSAGGRTGPQGVNGVGGWGEGCGNLTVYRLRAGTAYLSLPAACPPGCTQGPEATKGPGEPADISVQRVVTASLEGAAFWINIVLVFFFISLQTSPSQRPAT